MSSSEGTSDVVNFSRAQLFDLYVIDRDARKATGFGFLPPQIASVVEKAALLGNDALELDAVNAAFSDLTNRHIQDYFGGGDRKEGGGSSSASAPSQPSLAIEDRKSDISE